MPFQGKQLWGSAIVLAIGGVVAGISASAVTTLSCDRLEAKCRVIEGSFPTKMRTMALNTVKHAEVVTTTSSRSRSGRKGWSRYRGSKHKYQLVLKTSSFGDIHFAQASENHSKISDEAQKINAFLTNPNQPTLRLTQDDRWLGILFGLIFMGFGGLNLLRTTLTTPKE